MQSGLRPSRASAAVNTHIVTIADQSPRCSTINLPPPTPSYGEFQGVDLAGRTAGVFFQPVQFRDHAATFVMIECPSWPQARASHVMLKANTAARGNNFIGAFLSQVVDTFRKDRRQ